MKKENESGAQKEYTLAELKKKLTEKERIFCHQYIIDWNATRSAKAAGYSEKTAAEIASQNLIKLHIKQYIGFIKENLEEESGITKLRNLNELAKIAYTSLSKLHNTWIERKDFELIDENDRAAIESIDTKIIKRFVDDNPIPIEIEFVKIKLFSKQAALSEINKMMGYNAVERIDHTTKGKSLNDPYEDLTVEELEEKLNELRKPIKGRDKVS